jgi:hypothetical protein
VHLGPLYGASLTGRNIFVFPEPVRLEVRTSAAISVQIGDGTWSTRGPVPRAAALAATVQQSEPARKALGFLRTGDWYSLYKVLDILEMAHGGEKAFERLGWASSSELKRFTGTANNSTALGDAARHARADWTPPKRPMSLDEAKSLIRSLLFRWLESLPEANEGPHEPGGIIGA